LTTVNEIAAELEGSMKSGLPYAPKVSETSRKEIPAESLSRVLSTAKKKGRSHRLWLRRMQVVGPLDLTNEDLSLCFRAEDCVFSGRLELQQARAVDLRLIDCRFEDDVVADQIKVDWNFELSESDFKRGFTIRGGQIGGEFKLDQAHLSGRELDEDDFVLALFADQLSVGQRVYMDNLSATGEVRLFGIRVGGELSMTGAEFSCSRDGSDQIAFNGESAEVGGNVFCDGITTEGEMLLAAAKIGGELQFAGATLNGGIQGDGLIGTALHADHIALGRGMHANGLAATGEVRLLGANIKGQLGIADARFNGGESPDGSRDALSADGAAIDQGVNGENMYTRGALRLQDAKLGGQVNLQGAELNAVADKDGVFDGALVADAVHLTGELFADRLQAVGEVRIPGGKLEGQLSMQHASLKSMPRGHESANAFVGDTLVVAQGAFLEGLTSDGGVRMVNARIGGVLNLDGARFKATDGGVSCLALVGSEIDELAIGLASATGVVDLRRVSVRSLWDADRGQFLGRLPDELLLDGFTYLSLREPLDAKQRLKWIAASQGDRHHPGVYSELAEAFRRVGYPGEARKVEIAGQRRARADTGRWSIQRLWHLFLDLTIGYGYRDWLALIWLAVVIGIGTAIFAVDESSFKKTTLHPPEFDPLLYAIDATVPVLGLGQTDAWSATGGVVWVKLGLSVVGYALLAAVVAAAAGLIKHDQR
jgi:hypothetical protein